MRLNVLLRLFDCPAATPHRSNRSVMNTIRLMAYGLVIAAATFLLASQAAAQISVLTNRNDIARTGQNLQETTLNTSNVNVSNFGKLFARTVDGYIYAQPLYMPGLSIGGKTRNVVYVATEHNSVYAFDADDPNTSAPLWQVNLGTSVPSNDVCNGLNISECPYKDLIPEIGITSTPVIDPSSGTIYVVAKTKNTSNSTYHFKLHALNLLTGAEKFAGPVEITATVSGTGAGSSGGTVTFNALNEMNRPGLLLLNGVVYLAFGSVGDVPPWHGWVLGYNALTLQQVAMFNATPNGDSGGLWGGGQGLAGNVDSVYGTTSNGSFDINTGGTDYGDTIFKLGTSSGLSVADYFTPNNQGFLNTNNVDLGGGGPMLLPGTSLLVNVGKDGVLRLVDTANMGQFHPTFNSDVQEFQVTPASVEFMGSPIYWDSPNNGPQIYLWPPSDFLKAYRFVGGQFQTTPVSQGATQNAAGGSNSAPLSLSANGSQTGTGIVWAAAPLGDAGEQTVTGVLRAFDATDLTKELWDSNQNPGRDGLGNYAKFTPPTIANGKVYAATFSGQLVVYGLNPPAASSISFMQVAAATPQTSSATVSVAYPQAEIASDLNIVVVGWNDTTSSVTSVSDTQGNAYALAVGPTTASGARQSIYYAKNIKGGSNTVTVNFNQAATFPDVRVLEYAGADTTSPLDVTAAATGSSTTANSGSATTSAANELIFAADTIATGTPGPGAGFTARIITQHDSDLAEDKIGTTPGSYSATAPLSPSGYWVMQMATFKVQSSTGSTAPTVASVSPTSGTVNGGTAVSISGSNFAAGATVTFGGTTASNINVVNSTSITATTPAHLAGTVNVVVTNTNGQSGTLTGGFTYTSSGGGPITFVQVAAATPQTPSSTVSVTYPSSQTLGHLNIVVVGWNDTTSSITSVSDTRGNSYILAVGPTTASGARQSIYYAKNITGGSNTVTATFNQAAAAVDMRVLEYSGLSLTNPLDVTAAATGSSTTANSGVATTTAANELIFAADTIATGTPGPGAGFTTRIITKPDSDIAEDRIVSTAGAYSATAPVSPSGYWVMQMVTFKQ